MANMTMRETLLTLKKLAIANRLYEKVATRTTDILDGYERNVCVIRNNLIVALEENFDNVLRVTFDKETKEPVLVNRFAHCTTPHERLFRR